MHIRATRDDEQPDGSYGWLFRQGEAALRLPRGEQSRWPTLLDAWLARARSSRLALHFATEADRTAFIEDFETTWYEPSWLALDESSRTELASMSGSAGSIEPSEALVADLLAGPGLTVKVEWQPRPDGGCNVVPDGFLRWIANGGPSSPLSQQPPASTDPTTS